MRVHDINIEVDLNRRNPNSPSEPSPNEDPDASMEFDGTPEGVKSYPKSGLVYTSASEFSDDNSKSWWALENYWPVLHFLSEYTISALSYLCHYTVDLLMNVIFVALSSEAYDGLVEFVTDWASWAILAMVKALMQVACICYNAFDVAASTNTLSLITVAALGVAIVASIWSYLHLWAILKVVYKMVYGVIVMQHKVLTENLFS